MKDFIITNIISLVSILIALISLSVSISIAIRNWYIERFNIDFSLVKWFGASSREYPFFIWLNVQNNSKLPISIIEIELKFVRHEELVTARGNGNKQLISLTSTNTDESKKKMYSLDYPIFIDSYGSAGGYFHVFSEAPFWAFEDFDVKMTLKTNRGSKTKTINFDYGKNIYRVWQYKQGEVKIENHSDGTKINYIKDSWL